MREQLNRIESELATIKQLAHTIIVLLSGFEEAEAELYNLEGGALRPDRDVNEEL